MSNWKKFGLLLILYGGFIVFLLTTNPASLPLPLLILPFAWLYLCVLVAAYYFLKTIKRIMGRKSAGRSRTIIFASLIALVPASLLVLQSIDQLSTKDVLLMGVFVLLLSFYLSRVRVS